jgi:hypothetical protein
MPIAMRIFPFSKNDQLRAEPYRHSDLTGCAVCDQRCRNAFGIHDEKTALRVPRRRVIVREVSSLLRPSQLGIRRRDGVRRISRYSRLLRAGSASS